MRKTQMLILVILIITAFGGCSKKNDGASDESTYLELSELSEITKDIAFTDTEYNLETDSQNYFNASQNEFAAADSGYYFCKSVMADNTSMNMLLYFDKKSGICLPVCQRSDCEHNNSECDADMGEQSGNIVYYNSKLYYINSEYADGAYRYILYSMNMDGSVHKKEKELYSFKKEDNKIAYYPGLTIHRGYAYFYCMNGPESYLYQFKIDGSDEIKEICRCTGFDTGIYNIQGYGNGIMFMCHCYKEETDDVYDINEKILYYSQDTGEVSLLADGNIGSFAVTDNSLVYSDGKDMLNLNLNNFTTSILVENEVDIASFDGENIYLDNLWECSNGITDFENRKIDVYDMDKNCIDTISMAQTEIDAGFGDSSYLFQYYADEENNFDLYMLDKKQIGTGRHEWKKLSLNIN